MTCRELAELLIDYVAGELEPEKSEHVKQHLVLCPPCEIYIQTYQVTIRLTRKLPPVPLPPELEKRLRAAVEEAGGAT
jgi:anti-sigma factor RsiW